MMKKKLYAHILLDRSGSMEECRDSTISAFNEYVNTLRTDETVSARVSLTLFDSESIDLVFDRQDAAGMPKLTRETFVPRGMTPLNDAIGRTAAGMDKETLGPGENVAFVILTDGLENASREYSREAVRKLLERVQKEKNWLVIYLGANQDAFAEGAARGVAAAQSMAFDTGRMPQVVRAAAQSTLRYAEAASPAAAAFTPEERKAARSK
jgi:Mg-chelatase subunit ChlD